MYKFRCNRFSFEIDIAFVIKAKKLGGLKFLHSTVNISFKRSNLHDDEPRLFKAKIRTLSFKCIV